MDIFTAFVIFAAVTAATFFAFGVLAGYRAGRRAGHIEAVDEMQPSYAKFMVALARVPNRYKDFNYSDKAKDDKGFNRMMLQEMNRRNSERGAEEGDE